MRPICGTVPKIHVKNEMGEEEYARTVLPNAQRLLDFGRRTGGFHRDQPRRATRRNADKSMVTLYDFLVRNNKVTFEASTAIRINR